ncbi:hypothetical protein [Acidaminobacter sp.]|uniref:hypothetical protein n=1 Tax=Acidaminobacter sp. TaxID=1872102 RepID=UPI00138629F6|nr:hypothetical protein [Acidaminobacter sp.]MDK9710600.1 flagellar protein FlgN [Acidaminobacter sp.]MZQ96789.1 hypothetical protein [Acidaminobacter sp.]
MNNFEMQLVERLQGLLNVMEQEKDCMTQLDYERLDPLVEKKTRLTIALNQLMVDSNQMSTLDKEVKKELRTYAEQIRILQETNGLLARQSIAYLAALREALLPIRNNDVPATYAESGEKRQTLSDQPGWLDKSI